MKRVAFLLVAAQVLGGALCGQSTSAILKQIEESAKRGRPEAVAKIAQMNDERAAAAVLKMVMDETFPPAGQEALVAAVSQWQPGPGRSSLVAALQKKPQCPDRALQFYTELALPETLPVFLQVLAAQKDVPMEKLKDPGRHAAVVRALGRFPEQSDGVVAYLTTLLDPKAPHVLRISTAKSLGGIRNLQSLSALVAQVGDTAIGDTAVGSLYQLTGEDFGTEVVKWREWLAANPAPPLKMLTAEAAEQHRQEKAAAAAQEAAQNFTGFYGIEFKSRNALFILDCSGSMSGERMTTLKAEMSGLLSSIQTRSPSLQYAILTFDSLVQLCGRGLMENTPANFRKAERFVEDMKATGSTAMVAAFNKAAKDILPDGNVDTIYFLSDGVPSDGTPDEVMAVISRIHYEHQVRIHTINLTGGVAPRPATTANVRPPLLQEIASHTGGTYKAL